MTPSFATSLDALGGWRAALGERVEELARFLGEHDLPTARRAEQLAALRERLGNEKLVVAFVAEFSRGKSELINAIFFADTGRRILPATPGRTTMCPVELGWRRRRAGVAACCCRSRPGSKASRSASCAPSRAPGAASRSTSTTPTSSRSRCSR